MVGVITCIVAPAAIPTIVSIATQSSLVAGTAASTATAAAAGASATAATASGAALATTGSATALALGPLGVALIGHDEITLDCWKQVLHDASPEPSKGVLLRELINDKRVKSYQIFNNDEIAFIIIENIWNERFKINFFNLNRELVGHVVPI